MATFDQAKSAKRTIVSQLPKKLRNRVLLGREAGGEWVVQVLVKETYSASCLPEKVDDVRVVYDVTNGGKILNRR